MPMHGGDFKSTMRLFDPEARAVDGSWRLPAVKRRKRRPGASGGSLFLPPPRLRETPPSAGPEGRPAYQRESSGVRETSMTELLRKLDRGELSAADRVKSDALAKFLSKLVNKISRELPHPSWGAPHEGLTAARPFPAPLVHPLAVVHRPLIQQRCTCSRSASAAFASCRCSASSIGIGHFPVGPAYEGTVGLAHAASGR